MLECRACVLRAIRAIASDASATTSTLQRPLVLTPQLANRRRRLATAVEHPSNDALSALEPIQQPTIDTTVRSKKGGPIVIHNEKALRKELDHLKDRVKLADHVDYVLRNNQPDKALDLCRLASRQMECVVAWNHTISWHLNNDRVNKAVDIYNEMKKRGQHPDSYTYVRMLQGFMDKPELVSKAISIYNGMYSPTSKVKPSAIHSNAAISVCAMAKDMDGVWGIVARMQDNGPNAPDKITYTTILQAIRHQALGDEADPALMEKQRQEAVNEGRRIWQEIIDKWRAGELMMDETLVVAMADLLLTSNRLQDWDDVLSLVQQTTRLARLAPALGSPERHTGHVPQPRQIAEGSSTAADPDTQSLDDPDGFMPTPSNQAFKSVTPVGRDPQKPRRHASLAWVDPGNGMLSVLIRACAKMRIPKTAYEYWDVLTGDPFSIRPDKSNFQEMLRLLRINRSSVRAAHTIQRAHNENRVKAEPRTYQIAMEVCARDHRNINIVSVAQSIIDDMEKHLEYPDVTTLCSFLSIALKTNHGPGIVTALIKLQPLAAKMRDFVRIGPQDPRLTPEKREELATTTRDQALSLFRAMIGTINTIQERGLVPESSHEHWTTQRARLDQWLSEVKFGLGEGSPQRRPKDAFGLRFAGVEARLRKFQNTGGEKPSNVERRRMGSNTRPRGIFHARNGDTKEFRASARLKWQVKDFGDEKTRMEANRRRSEVAEMRRRSKAEGYGGVVRKHMSADAVDVDDRDEWGEWK